MVGLPGGSVDRTRRDSKLTDNGSVGHPGFHLEVAKLIFMSIIDFQLSIFVCWAVRKLCACTLCAVIY